MTTFTAWRFPTADGAEGTLTTLERLQGDELITAHDAAIVTWAADRTKPRARQLQSLTGAGGLGGAFWAATGALTGTLADAGIDDTFTGEVRGE